LLLHSIKVGKFLLLLNVMQKTNAHVHITYYMLMTVVSVHLNSIIYLYGWIWTLFLLFLQKTIQNLHFLKTVQDIPQ